MNNLFEPLSDEEIELLDQFLLDRFEEVTEEEGWNEGVVEFSQLDGLFTAIVSGPVLIPPSTWLPAVWGDFEPEWQSKREFDDIYSLMARHMNDIAGMLMDEPEAFEPLFLEHIADGKLYTDVDEWCEGYMMGVALGADDWHASESPMAELLAPIQAFTLATNWRGHALGAEAEVEQLQESITPNVRAIHAWWLATRH